MKQVFLVPAEGIKIRNHDGRGHIPAEGANRMLNSYYNRRIADGDLSIREEKNRAPAAEPAKVVNSDSKGKK